MRRVYVEGAKALGHGVDQMSRVNKIRLACNLALQRQPRFPRAEALESRTLLSAISGFALVDATTGETIQELHSGAVINPATLESRRLNLVAHTEGTVQSVRFGYNAGLAFNTDSTNDFQLAEGEGIVDLTWWLTTPGVHTVAAVPFEQVNAGGAAGAPMAVIFYVGGVPQQDGVGTRPSPTPNRGTNPRNLRPSVTLGDTALGTFGGSPGYFLLKAEAADTNGKIDRVEFFANGELVGAAAGAPWMLAWRDVPPGTYEVIARAIDNEQAAAISEAGTITVITPSGGRTIKVEPGESINDAVRTARAGDTVLIEPGVYEETIHLRNSGTQERPITIRANGQPGSVIVDADGANYNLGPAYAGAGQWNTVQGITFRNAQNQPGQNSAAVKTATGGKLIDVRVERATGAAIGVFGDDVLLLRVTAEANGCTGIGGSRVRRGMMLDSISHGNNTLEFSGRFEGGGGKFTRTNGFLVDNYHSYDNQGPGIWIDIDNINVVIRDSVFNNNRDILRDDAPEGEHIGGRGIMLEISGVDSDGAGGIAAEGPILIERNLMHDNDNDGLHVYSTANVTAQHNTFVNDPLDLKDERPSPWMVRDLTVINNYFKDTGVVADGETVKNFRNENLVIDHNTYDFDGKLFRWGNRTFATLPEVQSGLGFEQSGTVGEVVVVNRP